MTRLALLISVASLAATGCLSSSSEGEPLAEDTYFTGVPMQYSSTADCQAHSTHPFKWDCSYEIALCHTGKAGMRMGDVVVAGSYGVEDGVARGRLDVMPFALELATATEPEEPIQSGIRWELDTAGRWMTFEFDVVSCD